MVLNFLTPSQIAKQYLDHLQSLKPDVNTAQTDSDWWIKGHTIGGLVSGIYADQRLIAQDINPQNSRRDALEQHLITWFGSGFNQASPASGFALVTASATGADMGVSTEFVYEPNGNTYQSISDISFGSSLTALIPIQSVGVGQSQNLQDGAILTLSSPAGFNSTAVVVGTIDGGSNGEDNSDAGNSSAKQRVLTRIRARLAGGKKSDYEQFVKEAHPSVNSVNVIPFAFGFGSIAITFTAGTSDIDSAIDKGDPIVLIPNQTLIDIVQAYVDQEGVITDCVYVTAPAQKFINCTVRVRYAQGTGSTILSGQALTQDQLIQREASRAIYKTPPGGRQFGSVGYVVASEIEAQIEAALSAQVEYSGTTPILLDWDLDDLAATGPNISMLGTEVAIPGTITVVPM